MKELLKFITCGSVDDGKSTLIGHMLYDAKLLFTDQEQSLKLDSMVGSADGNIDYSLLLDGLMAEREQGITIDVAYRYFSTEKRSFIVADTPGHEEYTRNMAVGASFADLAVLLIDATKGVVVQTKRHLRICALMGITHFIFAVNKMDLVDYSEVRFKEICAQIDEETKDMDTDLALAIPVSATEGDNINIKSDRTRWYSGQALLSILEEVNIDSKAEEDGFLMPIQRVCRPNRTFRGFQGEIAKGSVRIGDELTSLPSGETAKVSGILVADKEVGEAGAGMPVTISLDREIDVSRGCILNRNIQVEMGREFLAEILWMDEVKLVRGRNYYLKLGTQTLPVVVSDIRYRIDVNTGEHLQADEIEKNALAVCEVSVGERTLFAPFALIRELGSFILIDRVTNATAACGVVLHAERNKRNLSWQQVDIDRQMREESLGQKARTIWFTGLSGSGKSAIGNALEKRLHAMGMHTMLLDGDNIRMGLSRDLSFSEADRAENIRRIAEVAKLLNEAGIIVITTFISPLRTDRHNARIILGDSYHEVYVNTPLAVCEERDVKGLYKRARAGEIEYFTGINSPYDVPKNADVVVETVNSSIEDNVDKIMKALKM
ncbi:MAG: adenylyl-sulfate kinase [Lachnospiraceae bacterium]|nr:adenylyl-sulfate kinase [Lachnospiraceae bacterium]